MLIDQEKKFREIMQRIVKAGACGFCSMDAAISYIDGNGIAPQIRSCKKNRSADGNSFGCLQIVKQQLDEVAA